MTVPAVGGTGAAGAPATAPATRSALRASASARARPRCWSSLPAARATAMAGGRADCSRPGAPCRRHTERPVGNRSACPPARRWWRWAASAAANCSRPFRCRRAGAAAAQGHGSDADPGSAIERFITACWDIGLEIGSSVRTVDECLAEAARDVTVQTALLGSAAGVRLAEALQPAVQGAVAKAMDPKAFLRAKTLEMQQRHVKYEGTPYSLEPNCKESPGGLRDLQVVIWVARAAGLGRTWAELASKGLITPFEVSQLSSTKAR